MLRWDPEGTICASDRISHGDGVPRGPGSIPGRLHQHTRLRAPNVQGAEEVGTALLGGLYLGVG